MENNLNEEKTLKVETVDDVTYQNIKNRIKEIESDSDILVSGGIK